MKKDKENKLNVAMVGYFNTLPFLYGLKKSGDFNLILDIPSKCMEYYSNGQADIALVPVATLLDRNDYKIVTDYCIGCNGAVRTVCLYSNGNIKNITKIFLDKDSRTSQLLVKMLCNKQWGITPEFEELDVTNIESNDLKSNEAVLMIGDKVFQKENLFQNSFDLGVEWKKMTGLPFTFAVWIARKNVDPSIILELNKTLGLGVNKIDAVLNENKTVNSKIDLAEYFGEYIDFHFDNDKKKSLNLFNEFNANLFSEKFKNLTAF